MSMFCVTVAFKKCTQLSNTIYDNSASRLLDSVSQPGRHSDIVNWGAKDSEITGASDCEVVIHIPTPSND